MMQTAVLVRGWALQLLCLCSIHIHIFRERKKKNSVRQLLLISPFYR